MTPVRRRQTVVAPRPLNPFLTRPAPSIGCLRIARRYTQPTSHPQQRIAMLHRLTALFALALLTVGCATSQPKTGNVIFFHPDGTSASNWAIARAMLVGPDGQLNWDKLPAQAVYTGHMGDSLTATSNGGATTHAYGVKVASDAYGTWGSPDHAPIVDAKGESLSIAKRAIKAGHPVGLVQTGITAEPGTGCFLASVEKRSMVDQICAQLVASDADVLFGGGEKHFLPTGTQGQHGPGARNDDRNLIQEAQAAGYTVVYTLDQLQALPATTDKVLGLFAHDATFNAASEEELAEQGLPPFDPDAPTVAQMTDKALQILNAKGKRFLLIVEEEGTDNLGNAGNASGLIEGLRRADQAVAVLRDFLKRNPDTLLLNAADSDAGGARMDGLRFGGDPVDKLPATTWRGGAPVDGVNGAETAPFTAAPDQFGQRLQFAVVWAGYSDVSGGILVRAEGLNSDQVQGIMDNTALPQLMHRTLLGAPAPQPANHPRK